MALDNDIPSYESLLAFQEVYTRAIGLAWNDNTFRQALINDPLKAMANYLGYQCPWNITIEINPVQADNLVTPRIGWHPERDKWVLPQGKLTVSIPNCPPEAKNITLALGMYNDAGPQYLFSCC